MFKAGFVSLTVAVGALWASAVYGEIYLSEIQFVRPNGAPPRVELFNASDAPIDISGWVLGDSVERGYTFPSGTVVESEGIVVVSFGGSENDGDEVPENCTYLYCQSEYGDVAFRSQDGGKCSLFSSTADAGEQKENQLMDYMIWGSNQYLGNRPLKVSWLRLCGSPISLDEELEKKDSAYFFSEVGSIAVTPDFRTSGLSGTCVLQLIRKDAWKWEEKEERSVISSRLKWLLRQLKV